MPNRKMIIGGWGEKYTSAQLGDALQNNRGEFLELCRRVTCDELAAVKLLDLVERHLENPNERSESGMAPDILKSIKLSFHIENPQEASVDVVCDNSQRKIDKEINLIQLLAEVHRMSVLQSSKGQ